MSGRFAVRRRKSPVNFTLGCIVGWVYVITNAAIPNLVKIGCTDRDAEARAKELGATGVPGEHVVKFKLEVSDAYALEREVHQILGDVRHSKEWFRCTVARAQEIIEEAAGVVTDGGSPLVPGHPLEPYFPGKVQERSGRQARFVVAPAPEHESQFFRPVIGDMLYRCRYCGNEISMQTTKFVRCSYCGKTEVVQ